MSDAILAKYLATINHEEFYADKQTNVFALHEYSVIDHCSADFSVSATSATVERDFLTKGSF